MLRMFPAEIIHEVSPRSSCVRRTAKFPMFFLLVCTGLIGGVTTTLFKMVSDLLVQHDVSHDFLFFMILLTLAIPGNGLQLYFINVSMKYYDQIEVIPVFLSSALVFILVSGLIIFDEIALYNAASLVGITIGTILCLIGI